MRTRPASERERPPLVTPVFVTIVASSMAYFIAVGGVLALLPRFVRGPLRGDDVAVGVSVGAFTFTAVVLRPLAGRLGDRRGRRLLMFGGSAVVAASFAAYSLASAVPVLVALRLLTGAGEGLFFTGAGSAINDLAPNERRGEAISYFSLAVFGGLAVGPAIGEFLLDRSGFDAVWWAAAGGATIAAVLAASMRETRPERATDASPGRLLHRAALVPGTVHATNVWGFAALSSFVPLYALQLGMPGSRFVFLVYSGIILAIRSVGATIPDRLGPKTSTRAAMICSITGLLLMGTWASPTGLFLGTSVFAVGVALLYPGLMTMAIHAAPESERGSVVGTFTAFFDLSYGLGALTLGAVASAFGYRGTFVAAALAGLGGFLLLLVRTRGAEGPVSGTLRP
ncbi:MAG TPA: MFS transporter [Actinomycetota bacterium]|nr:MFS transporter [Actinomycetota bacterium]